MSRYYFNIRSNDRLIVDEDGLEMADLRGALEEARLSASAMLVDAFADGIDIAHQVIEITATDGAILHALPLTHVAKAIR